MKRCIHAAEETTTSIKSNADIVDFLQSKGIDTTRYQYELTYTCWDYWDESQDVDKCVIFTCPGDYLALFAEKMATNRDLNRVIPTFNNIDRYLTIESFIKMVEEHPTFDDLRSWGSRYNWFFHENAGNIKLVNLTTGAVLLTDDMV